jgi:transcriptional regulator with XRE-family HTH domain
LREELKHARRARHVRQTPLAKKLGWPQSVISMIESSGRGLEAAEFIMFALAIGADPRELLEAAMKKAGVLPTAAPESPPQAVRAKPRTRRRKGKKPK